MSVKTNVGGGGITKNALYNAIQYSGIVESTDTANEMLAKLSAYYTEEIYVFINPRYSYSAPTNTDVLSWSVAPHVGNGYRAYIAYDSGGNYARCTMLKQLKSLYIPTFSQAMSINLLDGETSQTISVSASTATTIDLSGWNVGTIITITNATSGHSYIDQGITGTGFVYN